MRLHAETPHGRNHPGDGRAECAPPIMEVSIEQEPAKDRGRNEDKKDLIGVVVNPAVQLGLAGDPDRVLRGRKGFNDGPLNLVKDLSIVESPFDEVGFNEQGLAVERDKLAVNRFGVVANLLDFFDFFIGLRGTAHDGWRGDRPAEHGQIPGRPVTNRRNLVMVHARRLGPWLESCRRSS